MERTEASPIYPRKLTRLASSYTSAPVVWALDAFSKDFETHARTAEALRAQTPESLIHPVYILSEKVFADRGYSSFLRAALKPRAHQNLLAVLDHEFLIPVRRSGALQSPRVLIEESADASACINKLLRYARRVGAQLIGIGTSGRSRVARLFTGSFAQTIIRESQIPLLVTGPCQRRGLSTADSVLLPTDFSPGDQIAFKKLLPFLSNRRLTLHLIHRAFSPADLWVSSGTHLLGGGWGSVEGLMDDEKGPAAEAAEWVKLAEAMKVQTQLVGDTSGESAVDTVLNYAQTLENPLIAILKSGPVTRRGWLPAGWTRDLIRSSPYSLYISGASV